MNDRFPLQVKLKSSPLTSLSNKLFHLPSPPLRLLQDSNAGTYIWTQLVLGVLYLVYFLLQCLALCQSKALDVWYVLSLHKEPEEEQTSPRE
jgi:hypothetical protein